MTPHFSFDRLDILTSHDSQTVLRGHYYVQGDQRPCVIRLPNDLFHRAVDSWLADKARIYTVWKDFGGVMGRIRATKYTRVKGGCPLRCRFPDAGPDAEIDSRLITVPLFDVTEIEDHCNMEHG